MVYELEFALIAVISTAMALFSWIVRELMKTMTNHLAHMTENQAKIAVSLDIMVQKLMLWDERWADIKTAVDITVRGQMRAARGHLAARSGEQPPSERSE